MVAVYGCYFPDPAISDYDKLQEYNNVNEMVY
jgi:hypothetical protein